jgi:NAD(P)-dependent dehydrogenase (short-subunit alcohol dehydrogenase family)
MTSTNWTAADLPDLSGKTVVVTGASSRIGIPTTSQLARAGARVVLAVRNTVKGEEVSRTSEGRTDVRRLELTSLASIREFADAWTGDLDTLVNNARDHAGAGGTNRRRLRVADRYQPPGTLHADQPPATAHH